MKEVYNNKIMTPVIIMVPMTMRMTDDKMIMATSVMMINDKDNDFKETISKGSYTCTCKVNYTVVYFVPEIQSTKARMLRYYWISSSFSSLVISLLNLSEHPSILPPHPILLPHPIRSSSSYSVLVILFFPLHPILSSSSYSFFLVVKCFPASYLSTSYMWLTLTLRIDMIGYTHHISFPYLSIPHIRSYYIHIHVYVEDMFLQQERLQLHTAYRSSIYPQKTWTV